TISCLHDTAPPSTSTLSLHDALPISCVRLLRLLEQRLHGRHLAGLGRLAALVGPGVEAPDQQQRDRHQRQAQPDLARDPAQEGAHGGPGDHGPPLSLVATTPRLSAERTSASHGAKRRSTACRMAKASGDQRPEPAMIRKAAMGCGSGWLA